jgi:TonB family protein
LIHERFKKPFRDLTVLLACGAILLLWGGSEPTHAQSRPKQRVLSKFDSKPFNPSIENLPARYLGHSFVEIFRSVRSRDVAWKKGEYESSIEHQNRLARLSSVPMTGSLYSDSILAFDIGPVKQEYDADRTALKISVEFEGYSGDLTVSWLHREKSVGSYIGRNAFNRAVRVRVYRYEDYELSVKDDQAAKMFSLESPRNTVSNSIVISPSEAQRMKPYVRALLLCRLSGRAASIDSYRDPPTIEEPTDDNTFTYTIHVVPLAVWFFDSSNGHILRKLDSPQSNVAKKSGCTPSIISKPEPFYTEEARNNKITGVVKLSATFKETGEVTDFVVISGLPHGLTERAVEAVKKIKFIPAEVNGKKVSCRVVLEYTFTIY